jgi:hypothetical protein
MSSNTGIYFYSTPVGLTTDSYIYVDATGYLLRTDDNISSEYTEIVSTTTYIGMHSYDPVLTNTSAIDIYTQDQTGSDGGQTRMIVRDAISTGLAYFGDYSSNFTTYSLVSKYYVDNLCSTKANRYLTYSVVFDSSNGFTNTITHNLGTQDITIFYVDLTYFTGPMFPLDFTTWTINNINSNSIDLTYAFGTDTTANFMILY